jgi:hypothetical protein
MSRVASVQLRIFASFQLCKKKKDTKQAPALMHASFPPLTSFEGAESSN